MPVGLQTKHGKRILAIVGCFAVWLLYTLIIKQIIRYDNNMLAKNLDLKKETYEIDQRVSVCFKDVAPSSMLLKQDANLCRFIHDLVIIVHTNPSDFQLRAEFRKTLRKVKKEATIHNLQIGTFFMLGLDKDQCVSSILLQEMSLEKDVLISSIVDSKENQTLKSVNTLRWFDENCSNSKLLLKLDAKMNPSTSFSSKQFYKLIKSWRSQNIVLLGSKIVPKLPSGSGPVPHLSLTSTTLDPISAQYLHLNYLLSRNVVVSLLKARADAINISAWKEDLFVTGVLANVALIRPKHDERFLKQCSGTFCIFCDCFQDLERQIDFSGPYYFAQRLTHSESPQSVGFIFQTETRNTNQYEPTTHTFSSTNAAETFFTELSTLTTPSFSETTVSPNEFTTFKSIGELTISGSTQIITNIPESTFSRENTDLTSETSSQFTETSTEQLIQSLESENIIVTMTTLENVYSSATVTKSLEEKITDLVRPTTNSEKDYTILEDSHVTETYVTQNSEMDSKFDVTRTTPQESYEIFSTTNNKVRGTEPALTTLDLHVDSTISTLYPTTDLTKPAETDYNPDVTSSMSDEFASTTNIIKSTEDDTLVNKFQEVDEQELSSTMTTFTETTTPTYLYLTNSLPINSQEDSYTGGSRFEVKPLNFKQTTTQEFQTPTEDLQSTDLPLITNFQADPSTKDMSTVINDVIQERTTLAEPKVETTEYSAPCTCNPLSTLKDIDFFTIRIPSEEETISTSDNEYITGDLIKETLLQKESFENINETESVTEIFAYRFNYSSQRPIQNLKNSTDFVDNNLKNFSTKSSLIDVNESLNSNSISSYIPTISPIDSSFITNSTNNQTRDGEILPSKKDPSVDFSRTIPKRRVKVRISSSTSKSESSKLESEPSSSKIQVRVTSSTSVVTNGKKKLEHRRRRKRKMKKIVIRIHKMFMKLPTTKTVGALKKYPNFSTFQKNKT